MHSAADSISLTLTLEDETPEALLVRLGDVTAWLPRASVVFERRDVALGKPLLLATLRRGLAERKNLLARFDDGQGSLF